MVAKNILLKCMMDDEFQKIFQEDEILEKLEKQRYNRTNEFFEFCLLDKEGSISLCNMPVQKLTPKKWCLLWILKNQFTINAKKVTKQDIDNFLYVITHDINSIQQILNAVDFCTKNQIDYEQAEREILQYITINFKPLTMLPTVHSGMEEEPNYGIQWLIHLSSTVARMAGVSAVEVMNHYSINTCYYYLIEDLKEKGVKIMVQSDEAISKAIFERTFELANDYYERVYGKEE